MNFPQLGIELWNEYPQGNRNWNIISPDNNIKTDSVYINIIIGLTSFLLYNISDFMFIADSHAGPSPRMIIWAVRTIVSLANELDLNWWFTSEIEP